VKKNEEYSGIFKNYFIFENESSKLNLLYNSAQSLPNFSWESGSGWGLGVPTAGD
jgi:hypothetical protein